MICWFSCGAASAVATKLALIQKQQKPIRIIYIKIHEEHPDNSRFLKECEQWFDHKIETFGNENYNSSIYEVFKRKRYLTGPSGAPCTKTLKKEVRQKLSKPGDNNIFGYTIEEKSRLDAFIDANNILISAPLIEQKLTKSDCLQIIKKTGIALPAMYRLGYKNNNCIGCVKGGAGYWNKIRKDFPEYFEKMANMEEFLGRTVTKITISGERVRIKLRDLPADAGRFKEDEPSECGIFCETAAKQLMSD